jgi:hypothetical protein
MNPLSQPYTLNNLGLNDLSARANQIKTNALNAGFPGTVGPQVVERDIIITDVNTGKSETRWGGLTCLIVAAIIIAILFFLFRPNMVLSIDPVTGTKYLDWGKLILWSLVFAFIIVLIFWFLREAF